jgi:AraC-like DNA-binding protein
MFLYSLLIISGFLGFLTIALLLKKYKSNRITNVYLIIIFLLVSLRFLIHGVSFLHHSVYFDNLIIGYNHFFLVIIPCIYLYCNNLMIDRKFFLLLDFKHFIIPIIYFLLLLKINSTENFLTVNWKITVFTTFFLYACTYCYLTYRLLVNKNSSVKDKLRITNKQSRLIQKWTMFLLLLSTLSIIRFLISLYLNIVSENIVSDEYLICISIPIWILIFLRILCYPEILHGYDVLDTIIKKEKSHKLEIDNIWTIESKKDSNNIQNSKLKQQIDKNIVEYIIKIEKKALNPKSFKDFKFTISDFAQKLHIPTSHLNYIFKYHCKMPFSDYKKTIRIHHAINLIQSGYLEKNTLESLAKEVGFASYNPFYSSFKDISGKAPREYVDCLN